FVDREYYLTIEQDLASRHNPHTFKFLDLGANVGYFTARVADLILQRDNSKIDLQGILVEGSPSVYLELKKRISEEQKLSKNLKIINGLIGERKGVGKIFESEFHITNYLFTHNTKGR